MSISGNENNHASCSTPTYILYNFFIDGMLLVRSKMALRECQCFPGPTLDVEMHVTITKSAPPNGS